MRKRYVIAAAFLLSYVWAHPAHAWNTATTGKGPAVVPQTAVEGGQGQAQGQQQGQGQGQSQGQGQTATGGAGGNGYGGNAQGGAGGTGGTAQSASSAAAGAASNSANAQSTTINSYSAAPRIPVATAYSAALTSGVDTCLGSASAGAQTFPLGLTIGGTRRDKNCEAIKNTHLIASFSPLAGCHYMLDHIPDAAKAWKEAGLTCEDATAQPPAPPPLTADDVRSIVVAAVAASSPCCCRGADPAPVTAAKPRVKHAKPKAPPSPACLMPPTSSVTPGVNGAPPVTR